MSFNVVLRALRACLFVLPLISCAARTLPTLSLEIARADGTLIPLAAEIAVSEAEQAKGYMGRTRIPEGTGMLFAYDTDRKMHFWMKDTPHPLSIAFIDSEGEVREIRDMEPFSLEVLSSARSVRHALEVPQGWFERCGVREGDRLTEASIAAIETALSEAALRERAN